MKYKEALKTAMQICGRQEQCRQDISLKLSRWDVNESDAEKILKKLENEGFINEDRYAGFFTRDKLRLNKWGKIKISWMLRQKNIHEDTIERTLAQIDNAEYENLLESELTKKFKTLKSMPVFDKKRKLIQFANQRGFENDVVYKIISRFIRTESGK